jgi:hypothetical protein
MGDIQHRGLGAGSGTTLSSLAQEEGRGGEAEKKGATQLARLEASATASWH